MKGQKLAIVGSGMVSGVGLNSPASCAAIRCGISNFQETRFIDSEGEWVVGSVVPLKKICWGKEKLIRLASLAIQECLQHNVDIVVEETPLLLCLSEHSRPGRMIQDDYQLLKEIQSDLCKLFNQESMVISEGRVSVAAALYQASTLIYKKGFKHVLIAATDSLLVDTTIDYYQDQERLLTSSNSNGFIPGEAGAALLIGSVADKNEQMLCCQGIGFSNESSHVESEEPLVANGLASAIKKSLIDAGMHESMLGFRIVDFSGEQYFFKEASLAFNRIDRTHRSDFDTWHPADCIGEVGAAIGAIMISILKTSYEKNYSKGDKVLAHFSNDNGKRAALIFSWS